MKQKLLIALAAFAAITSTKLSGQVSAYTFTQSAGSYGALSTGSLVGFYVQDDDVNAAALPFNFIFNGTSYNSINVCSNGYLSFNNLTGGEYYAISDGTTQNVLAPFAQDLFMATVVTGDYTAGSNTITNVSFLNGISVGDSIVDAALDFGGSDPIITGISGNNIILNMPAQVTDPGQDIFILNGSIKQMTSGTAPNRVCEFQFRNFTRFSEYDESISFKVKLYETSNKIEFIYGPIFPGVDESVSEVGLKGNSLTDYNSRKVTPNGNWLNSVASTAVTNDCDFSDTNYPASGLTYAWSFSCAPPTLTVTQTNSVICAGSSSTLMVSGATSYTWSTGSNSTQITVSPATNTTYVVTGESSGCTSSVSIAQNVSICTGLEQNSADAFAIVLYPNPSSGSFVLKTSLAEPNQQLVIYNILGAKVYSQALAADAETTIHTALPEGLYQVEISSSNQKVVKPLVITK